MSKENEAHREATWEKMVGEKREREGMEINKHSEKLSGIK